jgi:hypothetical protein
MSEAGATARSESGIRSAAARRRFRLLDAMILVAATAVGLWLLILFDGAFTFRWKDLYEEVTEGLRQFPEEGILPVVRAVGMAGLGATLLATPLLGFWTQVLLPLRLIGPRPRRLRLARQPGFIATFAAGVALVIVGVAYGALSVGADFSHTMSEAYLVSVFAPGFIGLAVLVSWLTLLVGGRWRAEPSWIDRLGRVMGAVWIVELGAFTVLIAVGG